MSCWESNATWQEPGTWFSGRKEAKSGSHVALEGSDVMLGVQRDVAVGVSLIFVQKRGEKGEPRRIGGARCRVGGPTRRGCGSELGSRAEKGQNRMAHKGSWHELIC